MIARPQMMAGIFFQGVWRGRVLVCAAQCVAEVGRVRSFFNYWLCVISCEE
jgi:hypothetical protein